MNFVIVDLSLLVLFILFVSIFLYKNKKNLKAEGSLLLYKTSWGIKLINYIGGKYKKTLKFLSYVSITLGYFLMAGMIFLIGQSTYLYLTTEIARTVKAPPIAPLIPYFPKLFGLQSFFPPFYFTYFILAIVIVATVHEFSHGIFARRFGIKIKSTGFAFLKYFPALFGAFVEQDDNQMEKAKKFEQMSVLSAGVFANVITTILFYFLLFGFFFLAFIPMGVQFDDYAYSTVEVRDISTMNGISVNSYEEILKLSNKAELNRFEVGEENYIGTKEILVMQKENTGVIILYEDAPAVNSKLGNVINEIEGVKITSLEILQKELENHSPGDKIAIKTFEGGIFIDYEIVLEENPVREGKAWLRIGFFNNPQGRISKIVSSIFPSHKKPNVYYEPKNEISIFIKDLLWWIFIINLLVALFNMLPLGILDGGRFFYLTILGLTGSEKFARKSFKAITYFIVFLFFIMMVKWILNLFL